MKQKPSEASKIALNLDSIVKDEDNESNSSKLSRFSTPQVKSGKLVFSNNSGSSKSSIPIKQAIGLGEARRRQFRKKLNQ